MPLIYTLRVTLQDGSQIAIDYHREDEALAQYKSIKDDDADRLRLQKVELFSHSEEHMVFPEPVHIRESDANDGFNRLFHFHIDRKT